MKLRNKIAGCILLLVTAPLIALAIALSYEADCAPAPALPDGATAMKAIVYRCYGPPEVLKLEAIAKPIPADQEILVKVRAAAGGVGTYAVQIAKSFGADVTGVCSTRNVSMVRSLGADHVIDYTKEDFTKDGQRYDMIFDTVGNHPLLAYRNVLQPQGILVTIGGGSPGRDKWPDEQDLTLLGNLMQEGKLRSVIDRRYTLNDVPAAVGYVETGRARGKVVIVPE